MFDHEKLQVYGKALDFAAKGAAWTSTRDKKHALVDHLSDKVGDKVRDKVRSCSIHHGEGSKLQTSRSDGWTAKQRRLFLHQS
jgi:hypothetical protein